MNDFNTGIDKANRFIHENLKSRNDQFYPTYHIAPPLGWINDPNGFSFYHGEYHIFSQYHPYTSEWGPMHWGHWISKDLLHWKWMGVALAPDTDADRGGCFSGTAIVKDDTLYLLYTGLTADGNGSYYQQQCLAYSNDGLNFIKSQKNPVIGKELLPIGGSPYDFRDPKIYINVNGQYCAIVSNKSENQGTLVLYWSSDLVHWNLSGIIYKQNSMMECPDIIDFNSETALLVSDMNVSTKDGQFPQSQTSVLLRGTLDDSKELFIKTQSIPIDHGMDFYAPQTLKLNDGRNIMIGWLQCWKHKMPSSYLHHEWNGCLSLPREIRIVEHQLEQKPIRELKSISKTIKKINGTPPIQIDLPLSPCRIKLNINALNNCNYIKIRIYNDIKESVEIKFDFSNLKCTVDCSKSGYSMEDLNGMTKVPMTMALKLQSKTLLCDADIFVDTSSIEIFANHGNAVLSNRVFPKQPYSHFEITSKSSMEIDGIIYRIQLD